jgi:DNA-binding protein HU-beta
MNKKDLIRKISITTKMTYKEIDLILTSVLENIILSVSEGEIVKLIGFGSFYRSQKFEKRQSNSHSKMSIAQSTVPFKPRFSAGKFFKEKVSETREYLNLKSII